MKGRWIGWTRDELAWIEANAQRDRRDLLAELRARFGRGEEVTLSNLNSLCKRNGWLTGRTGHFPKGTIPPNKGKKIPSNANSARTQFKPGQRPHTWRGAGHERIDTKDGYVIMIVAEPNPWTGAATRPVHKHRYLWEQANGPVPKGMVLKCLDGDKTNTDPANWEAIPQALLLRLAGRWALAYDAAPAELKPILLATAKLEHAAREARKSHRKAASEPDALGRSDAPLQRKVSRP